MNKAIDATNLSAILRSKSVAERIPVYFRNKEPPIRKHEYTNTIASKLFTFASTLSNLDIIRIISKVHMVASVKPQSFAINSMAM